MRNTTGTYFIFSKWPLFKLAANATIIRLFLTADATNSRLIKHTSVYKRLQASITRFSVPLAHFSYIFSLLLFAMTKTVKRKSPTLHQKQHVWNSADVVKGKNPDLYRRDVLGNILYRPSYGKNTEKGWHIDHKKPLVAGGTNHTRNLQALQSTANLSKGGQY